jgi:hypothetical protein
LIEYSSASGSSTPLVVITKFCRKYSSIDSFVLGARPVCCEREFMKFSRHSQKCTASPMCPMQIFSFGKWSKTPEAIMRTTCVPTSIP